MIDGIAKPQKRPEVLQGKPSGTPALSAVVVIPDTYEIVRRTMECLRAQTIAEQVEIVIVAPSRQQIGLDERELACFHSWQVVGVGKVTSIGDGFAAGIRNARAPIVALTEDHSYPDANWAEAFVSAHRQPWAAVGPRMRNGNPGTMVSWADFYQAYGEWTDPISSGTVRHLPGHNSSYKRDILLSLGEELKIFMQAESVLHRYLVARDYRLFLETSTCTTHLNFDTWSAWIPARYHTGRQFASTWAHSWSRARRLFFTLASPMIPWVRLWRIQKRVCRREPPVFQIRLLPIMLVGLLVEGLGHLIGYVAGAGDSIEKVAKYEFHRIKK